MRDGDFQMVSTLTVEVREEGGELHGTILQEGRAASGGRAEVFAPGSVTWPAEGVGILAGHRGAELARAYPHRDKDGRITVRAQASDAIKATIASGKRFMSVEFRALDERTTKGGIREILRAFVDAAALVAKPEYDTTSAEVRSGTGQRRLPRWL